LTSRFVNSAEQTKALLSVVEVITGADVAWQDAQSVSGASLGVVAFFASPWWT